MKNRLSATQALEVETLCSALFDGSITPEQFRLLQVYLRISASSRQLFIQQRNLHGALAAACAYEVLPTHSFSGMSSHRLRTDAKQRGAGQKGTVQGPRKTGSSDAISSATVSSDTPAHAAASTSSIQPRAGTALGQSGRADARRPAMAHLLVATEHVMATSLSIASLVTILALVIMAVFTLPGQRLFERFTNTTPGVTNTTPGATNLIARFVQLRDCEWMDPLMAPGVGADLAAGQTLRLAKGLAEIKYRDGVRVILQGPAVFEISHLGQSRLNSGKLTATVPSQAIGYTVETPNARVIDLGTEFAVEVRPDEQTEVHVFQGHVEAMRLDPSGIVGHRIRLAAEQAAKFEIGAGQEPIPTFAADATRFQRTLDRSPTMTARKAWWRKSVQRLRADPELFLYYTFAGTGARQLEFPNQALAANKQFRCVWNGSQALDRGLLLVRGKWPWSAALRFSGESDGYLLVEGLHGERRANETETDKTEVDEMLVDGGRVDGGKVDAEKPRIPLGPIPLNHAMSLVVTVGSLVAEINAGADGEEATSDSATSLRGPILMNRCSPTGDLDFQLAVFSSPCRGQPGKVEFRINGHSGVGHPVAGSGSSNPDLAEIILSGEADLGCRRWHQLVAVCDGLAARLYCDGNQVAEQTLSKPLALRLGELSIGHGLMISPDGKIKERAFEGLIDDLAIFKRPLKDAEIKSLAELY